jgi:heavy metal sensor kinase
MRIKHVLGVRVRLTLWYVAAIVVVLAVYAGGVLAFVSRSASTTLESQLRSDFTWAAEMWEQRPDGTLTWFGDGDDEDSPWLQVWSPSGDLLFRTAAAKRHPLPQDVALGADPGATASVKIGDMTFRVLSRRSVIGGTGVVIQVARSEGSRQLQLKQLMLFMLLGFPLGAAAAGLGGYALARRALAPVERMAERARSITATRLSDRLPVDNPNDELGHLATVFNETLGRLDESFQQMQRFTADISHELRTPLTAMRTVGEVGLRGMRDADRSRAVIGSMLDEVDRLTRLIERLLTLSRATSGATPLCVESVDLKELATEVVAHLSVLAEEKGQTIVVEANGTPRCEGDRMVLRQALINLVDNAIKYSPNDGHIRVRTSIAATGASLEVIDSGPGIAPERRSRIFDRFYRGTPAGDGTGVGLGLSISKWAVEVNRGRLSWEGGPAGGSIFRVILPNSEVVPAAQAATG